MTQPDTISADYTLRPSELASVLALLVEARQPCIVWGPPGAAKSMIAQQVAADANRRYVDVRALLLDPVDLRGIPWRDGADRTRWAPPAFLPPSDDPGRWLINLEELPSAVPMVQAALYQLVLDRKVGEYELPEGASLIAFGNRETDRGVVHRMPTPLASRFVHLDIRVDARDWCNWGAANGIAPEVLFFIEYEQDLLHQFDPQSKERAFPCPRTWEFASNIVKHRNGLDPEAERALFRGTVGEAAAVEFAAFLKVWRELPHPRAVVNDPENADIPKNASALMALCGVLYKLASDVNFDTNVLLSTLLFHAGNMPWLRHAWQPDTIIPLASRDTTAELIRVLHYPKFRLTRDEREDLLGACLPWCETVPVPTSIKVSECRDPFDRPFLELALVARADALLTGDKDLLVLAEVFPVPILTPAALRERLSDPPIGEDSRGN